MKSNLETRKFLWFVFFVLIVFLIVFEVVSFSKDNQPFLRVDYLDVGQGDATLISYLGKYQVLIDGGPSGKKLLIELEKSMPVMDKKIEIVILTHPDKDHLAGLIDVVRNYQVGTFLDNGQVADTQIFRELEKELEINKIKRTTILEGSRISIGQYLNFKVFNPDQDVEMKNDRNENSVVLRMDFGENSFLFTGDATIKTENDMLDDFEDVDVDWLKVGHHGSKHSTSEEFVLKTSPEVAIASAGKNNRYKHPNKEVVDKLKAHGIELLRTDQRGTINVVCESLEEKCLLVFE